MRRVLLVASVLVVAVGVLLWVGAPPSPYDIDSADPEGYKALRLVLEDLGVEVVELAPDGMDPESTAGLVSLLVTDGGGAAPQAVDALTRFAEAGGRVVAAGPIRQLDGVRSLEADEEPGGPTPPGSIPSERCPIGGTGEVRSLMSGSAVRLDVPAGSTGCWGGPGWATVVATPLGRGEVVSLASPRLFVNDVMRPRDQPIDDPPGPMPDNVVLAVGLLSPDGVGAVGVVEGLPAAPTGGDSTLVDLMAPGVVLALWQLVVAFGVYAWWRGRRVNRVVIEPLPVEIAGSELTAAIGSLAQRQGDVAAAAAALRRAAVATLLRDLGHPTGTAVPELAVAVADRTGRDPSWVVAVVATRPVDEPDDLVRLARDLDDIVEEVHTHV